jgi:hypothetical protein
LYPVTGELLAVHESVAWCCMATATLMLAEADFVVSATLVAVAV